MSIAQSAIPYNKLLALCSLGFPSNWHPVLEIHSNLMDEAVFCSWLGKDMFGRVAHGSEFQNRSKSAGLLVCFSLVEWILWEFVNTDSKHL